MLSWEGILNNFRVKLPFKICRQVLYLVSSPLNSKAWETALVMTPRKEEKKWNRKGANRNITGETEERALPSSSFSSLLPEKIKS